MIFCLELEPKDTTSHKQRTKYFFTAAVKTNILVDLPPKAVSMKKKVVGAGYTNYIHCCPAHYMTSAGAPTLPKVVDLVSSTLNGMNPPPPYTLLYSTCLLRGVLNDSLISYTSRYVEYVV